MSNYYTYNNQIVTMVGEVAVHNTIDIPEAHVLLRSNNHYFTLPINLADKLLKPMVNKVLIDEIDNERKTTLITSIMEQMHGEKSKWGAKNRKRTIVRARQIYFWAMKTTTTISLTDLGKLLGHRFDHATVIHAIKVIEQDIEMNVHDVMLTATELARRLTEHGDNRLQLRLDMLVNN